MAQTDCIGDMQAVSSITVWDIDNYTWCKSSFAVTTFLQRVQVVPRGFLGFDGTLSVSSVMRCTPSLG